MKKYELWCQGGYHEDGLYKQRIIPVEDIQKAVWADSYIHAKKADIEKYMEDDPEESITEYFDKNEIDYTCLSEWATEAELNEIEETGYTLFDREVHELFEADDLEYEKIYTYWDGSNHKTIAAEGSETEIVISDKRICLDEWDGSNWRSGINFCHDYIYRVADEDTYLLWQESQYQGDQPVAALVSASEIKRHIENLNEVDGAERDIDEYMKEIDAIEVK